MASWLDRREASLVEAVQALHAGPLDHVFELASRPVPRVLAALVGLALALRARRDVLLPVTLTLAVAAASEAAVLVKALTDRPRPSLVDHAVHPLVGVPGSASFPSGHAATAAAAAVVLGAADPRLRVPAAVLAAIVALSRVWLGVHYPSDVAAGAALGAALGAGAVWLAARARSRLRKL